MKRSEGQPKLWALAYQHLLLSIIGFGLRVYSQHHDVVGHSARWSEFHERIARSIFDDSDCVEIDTRGRLIVLDDNPSSKPQDFDRDGFDETIVIGREDAAKVVAGDPASFYEMVRARVHDWELLPSLVTEPTVVDHPDLSQPHVGGADTREVSEKVNAPSSPDTEEAPEGPTPADMPSGLTD